MVRLLHTADVHLSSDHPERRAALDMLLSRADDQDVDVVTIGGDLFDSETDAERLRSDLRDCFSDRSYPILAIPGNHDEAAFRDDVFFGANFRPVVTEPFEHVVVADSDVRITCVPYTPRAHDDLLVGLADRDPWEGTEILLLHCSLDAPFADRIVGDEDRHRYFPVSKHTLASLEYEYYLAGHYHSAHRVELPDDGTFVYPGSPASVTRSETGPRNAVVLDTKTAELSLTTIETFHYDHREFVVAPGTEDRALDAIRDWADARTDRTVEASITVTGHITMDEHAFHDALESASGDIPVTNRTSSIAHIVNHPLYRAFEEKLADRDVGDESLEAAVIDRTRRVFSELASGGRLP